jgi:hypothetical protein
MLPRTAKQMRNDRPPPLDDVSSSTVLTMLLILCAEPPYPVLNSSNAKLPAISHILILMITDCLVLDPVEVAAEPESLAS